MFLPNHLKLFTNILENDIVFEIMSVLPKKNTEN